MVGQIDDGRRVGRGPKIDLQLIGVRQGVGDRDRKIAGIAFFAVGADAVKPYADFVARLDLFGLPHVSIETFHTSVQMVGTVVLGQRVSLAVQFELTRRNAIAKATDRRTKKRMSFQIASQRGKTQVDVGQFSLPIRDFDGHHVCTEVGQLDAAAVLIRAGKQGRPMSVVIRAEVLLFDAHFARTRLDRLMESPRPSVPTPAVSRTRSPRAAKGYKKCPTRGLDLTSSCVYPLIVGTRATG